MSDASVNFDYTSPSPFDHSTDQEEKIEDVASHCPAQKDLYAVEEEAGPLFPRKTASHNGMEDSGGGGTGVKKKRKKKDPGEQEGAAKGSKDREPKPKRKREPRELKEPRKVKEPRKAKEPREPKEPRDSAALGHDHPQTEAGCGGRGCWNEGTGLGGCQRKTPASG